MFWKSKRWVKVQAMGVCLSMGCGTLHSPSQKKAKLHFLLVLASFNINLRVRKDSLVPLEKEEKKWIYSQDGENPSREEYVILTSIQISLFQTCQGDLFVLGSCTCEKVNLFPGGGYLLKLIFLNYWQNLVKKSLGNC